ncbi:GcrA family cell cycle regulator [uncultured Brevundimonas sp.]|uniref:GcrA family cell cycle regulator n=1 Tax=uncultured Brevundimonas sp. TaxID=213418 RepID=UPI00261A1FED|nr:GcrA family cell cycle regulator [uncultured Brevundimonas sp.]
MGNQHVPWTTDEDTVLTQKWEDGLSATEISRYFASIGCHRSRNSVIGRAARLMLPARAVSYKDKLKAARRLKILTPEQRQRLIDREQQRRAKATKNAAKAQARKEHQAERERIKAEKERAKAVKPKSIHQQAIEGFAVERPVTAVPLLDRRWNQCAWPVDADNTRDMHCCGAPTTTRPAGTMTSYCKTHFVMSASIIRYPEDRDLTHRNPARRFAEDGPTDLFGLLGVAA